MAGTLAEAGTWPLQLQALRYGLMFIARLKLAPEGPSLLSQFGQRPHLQAAQLLNIYEDIVGPEQPAIEPLPPPKTATTAYASPRAVITLWQDHLSDLRRVKRNHHVYARIAERLVALGIEKTVKEVKIENLGNLFG